MLDLDQSYHWFWCGNECEAILYGPFETEHYALANILDATGQGCEHAHIPFASTAAHVLRAFPSPRNHTDCYYSDGTGICRGGREMWRLNSYATVVHLDEAPLETEAMAKLLNSRPVAAAPRTVEDDLPTLQPSAGSRG